MKKFHPIVIKEYTPLTEPEMKNIFGGSGESGSEGGSGCTLSYYSGNVVVATVSGTCKTQKEVITFGSGEVVEKTISYCDVPGKYTGPYDKATSDCPK